MQHNRQQSQVRTLARAGLTAKGIVYLVLGAFAFMAAFELGGQSDSDTSRSGVFNSIKEWPAGNVLLIVLSAGLLCYSLWRIIQSIQLREKNDKKKWSKRIRYVFSALTYLSIAFSAVQLVVFNSKNNGAKNQYWAAELMDQPFGQWLVGLAALVLFGTGIYQLWYGLSEQYKKHVEQRSLHNNAGSILLYAGKIGYLARGIVWLLLAWLLLKASIDANPKEAGDTGQAFQFVEEWQAGSLLLAAIGVGLFAYGVFNFVRAAYERDGR